MRILVAAAIMILSVNVSRGSPHFPDITYIRHINTPWGVIQIREEFSDRVVRLIGDPSISRKQVEGWFPSYGDDGYLTRIILSHGRQYALPIRVRQLAAVSIAGLIVATISVVGATYLIVGARRRFRHETAEPAQESKCNYHFPYEPLPDHTVLLLE